MTKVEDVARALHDEWFGVGGWSSLTDHDRKRWAFMARAAIEAMRTPTEAMLEAGNLPGWDGDITIGLGAEVWTAMIDAALSHEGK